MVGGKALILTEQMGEEGTLLCNDRSADRKARLLRTLKVMGSLMSTCSGPTERRGHQEEEGASTGLKATVPIPHIILSFRLCVGVSGLPAAPCPAAGARDEPRRVQVRTGQRGAHSLSLCNFCVLSTSLLSFGAGSILHSVSALCPLSTL